MTVQIDDVRQAARATSLAGLPLCVHSSLRSFGPVEGGARTVVRGLLDEGCTVVVPTFSWTFSIPPPPEMRPPRNGTTYDLSQMADNGVGRVYTPHTNEFNRPFMGAVPAAVLEIPTRVRGSHPLNSFSGVGPLAHELVDRQTPSDVYAPLQRLTEVGGAVVLMGVGMTSMTILHLAERLAGRTLFRRWANNLDGIPTMVETGGCSTGFDQFARLLDPLERRVTVGQSVWRIFPAEAVLAVATRAIRADPWITHCGKAECRRCNDAVLGGPVL